MGCISRRNHIETRPEQKWDNIQLNDFKASSAFTYVAYGYLFFSLFLSTAVYAVDGFTAVNLLAFNKWSSEIQPAVSFDITKWIFAICIILSIINLAYEHIRAIRTMRRGSVAESYLDNLAVRLESTRMGSGRGWRRFLVFAELTKSKKGAEYIALFTYFSFQSWIRIIFCSGPRQVLNGITLYSVYTAKLAVDGEDFESSFFDFWDKIEAFAEQDYQQALILSGMVFTVIVWAFSVLSLLIAGMFFVFFLWGWMPKEDGGLSGYCERKINKRLMKIVNSKIDAAIAEQEKQRKKAELRAAKKAGEQPPEERKATLPKLGLDNDDKIAGMPTLTRSETMATLPVYTSRPATPNGGGGQGFEMNKMPPALTRKGTAGSTTSSRAPLLQSGAEMGRSSPAPPMPPMPSMNPQMGPPQLQRMQTNGSNFGASYTQTPTSYSAQNNFPPMPQPARSPVPPPMGPYGMPPRSNMTPAPRGTFDDYGRASPAPQRQMPYDYNNGSNVGPSAIPASVYPPPRGQTQSPGPMGPMGGPPAYGQQRGYPGGAPGGYPMRNATGPLPNRGYPGPPQRNVTAPMPQMGMQGEFRTLTPVQQGYSGPPPQRNMTPGPQPGLQRQATEPFRTFSPAQQDYFGAPPPPQRNMTPGPQPGLQRQGTEPFRTFSPAQNDYFGAPPPPQRTMTTPTPAPQPDFTPQPDFAHQAGFHGTEELRSGTPVQQYEYAGLDDYFDSPPAADRTSSPVDVFDRPGTAQSQRSLGSPPQLNRQPTYGSEREMESPRQLSRSPTSGSAQSSGSPAQMARQSPSGSVKSTESPAQLPRQSPYGGSAKSAESPPQLARQSPYGGSAKSTESPAQLSRPPTSGSAQAAGSPARLSRRLTYGSGQAPESPAQLSRPPTSGSGGMMQSPPQLARQPTYGSEGMMQSPPQLARQPTYGSEQAAESPRQLSRQLTYGSEREVGSPSSQQQSRPPTSGSERPVNSPPQPVRKPTYGSGWLEDLEGQRGSPGSQ